MLEWSSRLEPAHLGRDRDQILRKPIVYFTCNACAFIGDGSAELGVGDGPTHANEQDPVLDHAQEVDVKVVVA